MAAVHAVFQIAHIVIYDTPTHSPPLMKPKMRMHYKLEGGVIKTD